MYESAVELGIEKAFSPVWRTFVLAIQAGLQVCSRARPIPVGASCLVDVYQMPTHSQTSP